MKKFILSIFLGIYFASVCLVFAEDKFPFVGESTTEDLNVRAGNNINFEIVYKLKNSEKVTVLAREFDWYKITLPQEASCFVSAKYLVEKNDANAEVAVQDLNVRSRPDIKASILCQLAKAQNVKIVKRHSQDWYQIQAPQDCCGWVFYEYIKYYSSLEQYKIEKEQELAKLAEKALATTASQEALKISKPEEKFDFEQQGIIQRSTTFFIHPGTHKLIQDGKIICYLKGDKAKLNSFVNLKVKISGNIEKDAGFRYPVVVVEKISIAE
ncbi:MAG: hypothetical protein FJZ11_03220 [Candidatus Omnitrophica bacterium]|nr:hypothetical protein [Candidatus Omnitrophota bacterium]